MSFKVRSVSENLDEFYAGASTYIPNKYKVYLNGAYLSQAIVNLENKVKSQSTEYPIDLTNFNQWKSNHVLRNGIITEKNKLIEDTYGKLTFQESVDQRVSAISRDTYGDQEFEYGQNTIPDYTLEFNWACKDITIPMVEISKGVDESIGMKLDSIRNLRYTIVTGYEKDDQLQLTIIEQKGMIWYHFFNELANMFFDRKLMTPRDSVHKLNVIVETVINQDLSNGGTQFNMGQKFEFNSVVYTGGLKLTYAQENVEFMEHSISFKIPNPFQGTFNHKTEGLLNRFHDDEFITGRQFNADNFEANIPQEVIDYENFLNNAEGTNG